VVTAETSLTGVLKVLGDPTRLRILALLDREELAVGELSRALGMAQSRVSNHLRVLRDSDLLAERHAGPSTFLRRNGRSSDRAARLWTTLRAELDALPEHAADLVRLEGVLAERRSRGDAFFDRVAGQWDKIGVDFETGQARQRAAVHLLPREFVVADLGCGTGYFAHALSGQCSRLVCVDQSQGMLDEARKRLSSTARQTAIEYRRGSLDALPIADGELDGVVAGMVLHHLPALDAPLAEMRRVLKAGGTAVVIELAPHHEAWMRAELGDRHLGLEPSDVLAAMSRAGFVDVALDPLDDRYLPKRAEAVDGAASGAPLDLYAVRGRVPRGERAAAGDGTDRNHGGAPGAPGPAETDDPRDA